MIARGKVVFEGPGGCAACHGTDASGLLGPDLTDDQWWHAKGNYLELVNQILKGVPEEESRSGIAMLPKGGTDLSEAEVQGLPRPLRDRDERPLRARSRHLRLFVR